MKKLRISPHHLNSWSKFKQVLNLIKFFPCRFPEKLSQNKTCVFLSVTGVKIFIFCETLMLLLLLGDPA